MRKYLRRIMDFLEMNSNRSQPFGDITVLLREWSNGEADAIPRLVEAVYPELKRMAERRMLHERADHTLQATGLVHEFFLEIARNQTMVWQNRAHFLAVASQAMRRFLIDYARARKADRRGGDLTKLQLEGLDLAQTSSAPDTLDLIIVSEVLDRLAAEEPRMAKIVEMRCFGGLTYAEIAEVLDIDERTAKRDWQVARAWMSSQLRKEHKND